VTEYNIAEKVAAINSTLQSLKEQLPLMAQSIKELSATTTTHTAIIDILTKNLDKLRENVELLISMQHQVNSSTSDIDDILEIIDSIKKQLAEIQKSCDIRSMMCPTCKPAEPKKTSWLDYAKIIPIVITVITFVSTIAWYIIKSQLSDMLPGLIKQILNTMPQ